MAKNLAPRGELGWGPKMKALPNDKWRLFVQHMVLTGAQDRARCLRDSGYQDWKENSLNTYATQLLNDVRIQEAMRECSKGDMTGFLPRALRRLYRAVDDPQDPNGVKAAVEVMNRTGLTSIVEHHHVHSLAENPERLGRLKAMAAAMGVDVAAMLGSRLASAPAEKPKVIEAEFEDVTPIFDVTSLV